MEQHQYFIMRTENLTLVPKKKLVVWMANVTLQRLRDDGKASQHSRFTCTVSLQPQPFRVSYCTSTTAG